MPVEDADPLPAPTGVAGAPEEACISAAAPAPLSSAPAFSPAVQPQSVRYIYQASIKALLALCQGPVEALLRLCLQQSAGREGDLPLSHHW